MSLLAHFPHHKSGTKWFRAILTEIAAREGRVFQYCFQRKLRKNTEIWMFDSNHNDYAYGRTAPVLNLGQLPPFHGSHMIRDPRDIIVSAYFYHSWASERWAVQPQERLGGKTYRKVLQVVGKNKGLLFEMRNHSRAVINTMRSWDYTDPRIFEMRYEDFIQQPERWFPRWIAACGFRLPANEVMGIVESLSFESKAKRALGDERRKQHMRRGLPGDWKNHLTPQHLREFDRLFGDVIEQLGYEAHNPRPQPQPTRKL
jgi:hypothetical protein